jgi:hypothetical protein
MFEASSKEITTKVFRNGEAETGENEWLNCSPEERIEGVWILTRLCMDWNNDLIDEPRLQRTVTRVQRAQR